MQGLGRAWPRFVAWYRSAGRAAQIGIGCGALIIVCICATLGLGVTGALNGGAGAKSAHNPSGLIASQSTATATTAAASTATTPARATATTRATATSGATSGSAVLGGPGQAFITKYGPLTSQSNTAQGDLHFKQYPGVATDYLIVQTGTFFAVTPGASDAYSVAVAPPPSGDWSPTAAKQACAIFLPADAQFVKKVITRDSASNMVDGQDDLYTSVALARTFPASAFQDANQNPAPAGSFDVWYLYSTEGDSSRIASCTLMIGEQQTKG